jgi:cysteine desulfurase/selenocysteine lyase
LLVLNRRSDFPLLVANPNLHYLDSAASTQKPAVVLDALKGYYTESYANPHRGAYDLSVRATERYHDARAKVAQFFGVGDPETVVFTRGTTEALNLVTQAWGRTNVRQGDEIIVTAMEHHANFVPWQQLAIETGATFRICELTKSGTLDLDMLRSMLSGKTRAVAVAHISNVLGTINPIAEIVEMVRNRSDAVIVCDGAQSAPHIPVNFNALGVDFYAFSAHKMCGPMGIGGLIGQRPLLEAMPPYQCGGDMIEFVYDDRTTWNTLPHKFEAGTPNAADAYALGVAIDYLDTVGMASIMEHSHTLMARAYAQLSQIDGLQIYGPPPAERSGVISFTLKDVHPHDLATILDGNGVCIRAGHHCAQPLMRRLGVAATARASFYVYNNDDDITALVNSVRYAADLFAGTAS